MASIKDNANWPHCRTPEETRHNTIILADSKMDMQERPIDLEHLDKGKLTPGDRRKDKILEIPPWVDHDKIKRAKELYQEYSSNIQFGHLSGLMMIFLYTKNIEPFLFTGQSSNFVSLLRRYVATADHVQRWYLGDIWDPKDDAHKSLMVVKKMHKSVATKMNDDKPSNNYLYVSQFAMAMTQFSFVGLIMLFPERLGFRWEKRDMECFLHFWRCVSYILGMDDKYNICIGDYEEIHCLFQDILENEIKPGIRNPQKESVEMARDIVTVFSCLSPSLTWRILCEYWKDILDIPQDYILSIFEKIGVLWFRFIFDILSWYQWARFLMNIRAKWGFQKVKNNMPYYENRVFNYERKLLTQKKSD